MYSFNKKGFEAEYWRREIAGASDELVRKLTYYLDHDDERREIAAAGYRAVMQRHRIRGRLHEAARLIGAGLRTHGLEP